MSKQLTFDDAINMAHGCFDYSGGHDGIQTVINVLEAAKKSGLEDTQVRAVHAVGQRADGNIVTAQETFEKEWLEKHPRPSDELDEWVWLKARERAAELFLLGWKAGRS